MDSLRNITKSVAEVNFQTIHYLIIVVEGGSLGQKNFSFGPELKAVTRKFLPMLNL